MIVLCQEIEIPISLIFQSEELIIRQATKSSSISHLLSDNISCPENICNNTIKP